jgi:preprotein translocase subunit SecY
MCSDTVIALLSIYVILSILFTGFYISYKADIKNISILNSIKNFIIDLFKDRNILGKFLSSVVFLLSIPGMLFMILLAIMEVFVKLFIKIWKLGNR